MASNFKTNGTDLETFVGGEYVTKSYLIDVYPSIASALKNPGLWSWGDAGHGQLGDSTVTRKSSPVQTVARGTEWKTLGCGGYSTAAIKTDGTLWMWGRNLNGQLGDNSASSKSSPVQTVAGGTNWKQASITDGHAAGVKTDGTLWIWGLNTYGQLGNNSTVSLSSPVQTVAGGSTWKQSACAENHTAAIKTDGTLWVWGINTYGQLGTNNTTNRSSPVQTVAGGSNWKQVSTMGRFFAAVKTDGTLWTCGYNANGQLGDNSITYRSSPVQTVAGGSNWKQVSASGAHVAAIKTDGTLWMWGANVRGQLGDNTVVKKSSPVQTVAGGTGWKMVEAGGMTAVGRTAAIKIDGTLWMWGSGSDGEMGDGTLSHRSSPVQTVAGGASWVAIGAGATHTVALSNGDY